MTRPIDLSAAREQRSWRSLLVVDKQGNPKRTVGNTLTVLSAHPAWSGVLAYDEFGECVVVTKAPPMLDIHAPESYAPGDWTDEDTTRSRAWFSSEIGYEPTTTMMDEAVEGAARMRRIHPVRDWLQTLTWDGTPRIDSFVAEYLGGARSLYTCAVGRRWLISAVARIFAPGSKVDSMLVLEGIQGIGKSSAIRILAGAPWFADTGIVVGVKDTYQNLRRVWLYELGELASLRRSDIEKTKGFLSSPVDTYRPSYGHRSRPFPRQTVFAGTVNPDGSGYLNDPTGARRFWPVGCSDVDLVAIQRDREQLWAEARVAYEAGEPWHLDTDDLRRMAAQETAQRTEQDAWLPLVERWLKDPTVPDPVHRDHRERIDFEVGFTTADVALGALGFHAARIGRGDATRIGKVLHDLGYYARDSRVPSHGVTRPRRYFKVVTDGCDAEAASNGSSHNDTTRSDDYIHEENGFDRSTDRNTKSGRDVVSADLIDQDQPYLFENSDWDWGGDA